MKSGSSGNNSGNRSGKPRKTPIQKGQKKGAPPKVAPNKRALKRRNTVGTNLAASSPKSLSGFGQLMAEKARLEAELREALERIAYLEEALATSGKSTAEAAEEIGEAKRLQELAQQKVAKALEIARAEVKKGLDRLTEENQQLQDRLELTQQQLQEANTAKEDALQQTARAIEEARKVQDELATARAQAQEDQKTIQELQQRLEALSKTKKGKSDAYKTTAELVNSSDSSSSDDDNDLAEQLAAAQQRIEGLEQQLHSLESTHILEQHRSPKKDLKTNATPSTIVETHLNPVNSRLQRENEALKLELEKLRTEEGGLAEAAERKAQEAEERAVELESQLKAAQLRVAQLNKRASANQSPSGASPQFDAAKDARITSLESTLEKYRADVQVANERAQTAEEDATKKQSFAKKAQKSVYEAMLTLKTAQRKIKALKDRNASQQETIEQLQARIDELASSKGDNFSDTEDSRNRLSDSDSETITPTFYLGNPQRALSAESSNSSGSTPDGYAPTLLRSGVSDPVSSEDEQDSRSSTSSTDVGGDDKIETLTGSNPLRTILFSFLSRQGREAASGLVGLASRATNSTVSTLLTFLSSFAEEYRDDPEQRNQQQSGAASDDNTLPQPQEVGVAVPNNPANPFAPGSGNLMVEEDSPSDDNDGRKSPSQPSGGVGSGSPSGASPQSPEAKDARISALQNLLATKREEIARARTAAKAADVARQAAEAEAARATATAAELRTQLEAELAMLRAQLETAEARETSPSLSSGDSEISGTKERSHSTQPYSTQEAVDLGVFNKGDFALNEYRPAFDKDSKVKALKRVTIANDGSRTTEYEYVYFHPNDLAKYQEGNEQTIYNNKACMDKAIRVVTDSDGNVLRTIAGKEVNNAWAIEPGPDKKNDTAIYTNWSKRADNQAPQTFTFTDGDDIEVNLNPKNNRHDVLKCLPHEDYKVMLGLVANSVIKNDEDLEVPTAAEGDQKAIDYCYYEKVYEAASSKGKGEASDTGDKKVTKQGNSKNTQLQGTLDYTTNILTHTSNKENSKTKTKLFIEAVANLGRNAGMSRS